MADIIDIADIADIADIINIVDIANIINIADIMDIVDIIVGIYPYTSPLNYIIAKYLKKIPYSFYSSSLILIL